MIKQTMLALVLAAALLGPAVPAVHEAPENPLIRSWKRHMELKGSSEFGLEWISVGPLMNGARAAYVQGDPSRPGTLYAAFGPGTLWKTTDNGLTWKPIFENQSAPGLGDVALAPSRPETIWLGTGVDLKKPRNFTIPGTGVFRSDDGGTWLERSAGLPANYIRSICPSRFSWTRVYLAASGLNQDDVGCRLFVSEDRGLTWRSLAAGLPDEVAYCLIEDPTNENILYAGLLRGVYVSVDRGGTWALLGPNLQAAAVSDLVIQEREMDLIASTYGRGIYVMNIRPIQDIFGKRTAAANTLFDPPAVRRPWINDTHRDFSLRTLEKVPLTFYLTSSRDVTLSVHDAKGLEVKSWRLSGKKGFNQLRWDLVEKTADSPEPYFFRYREFAPAGEYELRLTGEGLDLRRKLKVAERIEPLD